MPHFASVDLARFFAELHALKMFDAETLVAWLDTFAPGYVAPARRAAQAEEARMPAWMRQQKRAERQKRERRAAAGLAEGKGEDSNDADDADDADDEAAPAEGPRSDDSSDDYEEPSSSSSGSSSEDEELVQLGLKVRDARRRLFTVRAEVEARRAERRGKPGAARAAPGSAQRKVGIEREAAELARRLKTKMEREQEEAHDHEHEETAEERTVRERRERARRAQCDPVDPAQQWREDDRREALGREALDATGLLVRQLQRYTSYLLGHRKRVAGARAPVGEEGAE
jgi:hypothetical protein